MTVKSNMHKIILAPALVSFMAITAQAQPWAGAFSAVPAAQAPAAIHADATPRHDGVAGARLWLVGELGGDEGAGDDGGDSFRHIPPRGKTRKKTNIGTSTRALSSNSNSGWRCIKGDCRYQIGTREEAKRMLRDYRKEKSGGQEAPAVQPEEKEKVRTESRVTRHYLGKPKASMLQARGIQELNVQRKGNLGNFKGFKVDYARTRNPKNLTRLDGKQGASGLQRKNDLSGFKGFKTARTRGQSVGSAARLNRNALLGVRTAPGLQRKNDLSGFKGFKTGKARSRNTKGIVQLDRNLARGVHTVPGLQRKNTGYMNFDPNQARLGSRQSGGNSRNCTKVITVVVEGAPTRVRVKSPGGC